MLTSSHGPFCYSDCACGQGNTPHSTHVRSDVPTLREWVQHKKTCAANRCAQCGYRLGECEGLHLTLGWTPHACSCGLNAALSALPPTPAGDVPSLRALEATLHAFRAMQLWQESGEPMAPDSWQKCATSLAAALNQLLAHVTFPAPENKATSQFTRTIPND